METTSVEAGQNSINGRQAGHIVCMMNGQHSNPGREPTSAVQNHSFDQTKEHSVGQTWFVSAFLGAAIIITGVLVMRAHYYTWLKQRVDPEIDDRERHHLHRRFRRRLQATGLLVLIGILIPVGDIEVLFKDRPLLFALHWFAVILLVMWVGLLAVGDLASTRAHSRLSLSRLEQKQRELEREAAALQSRRTNGRGPS